MTTLTYTDFEEGDISNLKHLCDSLMKFQAEHATVRADLMADMNFENRLVPDYATAGCKYVAIAYDRDHPIGFAFATVSQITTDDLTVRPSWSADLIGTGLFPENYCVPATIGTFKLLYVDTPYRGSGAGGVLSGMVMDWLNSHDKLDDLWVFVANGNEAVGRFYEKCGFEHSHSVYSGFIEAYCQKPRR